MPPRWRVNINVVYLVSRSVFPPNSLPTVLSLPLYPSFLRPHSCRLWCYFLFLSCLLLLFIFPFSHFLSIYTFLYHSLSIFFGFLFCLLYFFHLSCFIVTHLSSVGVYDSSHKLLIFYSCLLYCSFFVYFSTINLERQSYVEISRGVFFYSPCIIILM